MARRRVLLLNTDLQVGGTPTVVRELAIRLNRLGRAEVQVACLGRWGPMADELKAAGVNVAALSAAGPRDSLRALRQLIELLRGRGISTCVSFLIHANAMAAGAALALPEVRFIQSIQTTQPWPRWHWRLQALAHRPANAIVVPSPSVAQVARDWSGIPAAKIMVIPNAIDPADFEPARPAVAEEPLVRRRHIGFIGRLDPIKRIGDLLQAVERLAGQVHLDIFGEGAERPSLEVQIEELEIAGLVTLHGPIARPQEALAKIELFVLPSQAEGFGLVLIEAMAAGVPVVATDAPGIRDVVRHGQTGLLVPVGSPPDLAEAIARVLEDADLKQRLVAEGRCEVSRRFSWDAVLPQWARLLRIG